MRKIYKIEKGQVVETYESVTEASYESGLSRTTLHQALREKRRTKQGLYVDDLNDVNEYREIITSKPQKGKYKVKAVYQKDYKSITEVYDNVSIAANAHNVKYNTLNRELNQYRFWTYNGVWFYRLD